MSNDVRPTDGVQSAVIATRFKVFKAFITDAVVWVLPFVLAAAALAFPSIRGNILLVWVLLCTATLITAVSMSFDVMSLKRYGYTRGLNSQNLRVVDPENDMTLWKARLIPKKVSKLLAGKYEFLEYRAGSKD